MPRGSIGRRVARAAATGGSRAHRGRAPLGWYASLGLICVVGMSLIGYSHYEANHPAPTTTTTAITTTTIGPSVSEQWYAALTFDVCGKVTTLSASKNTKTAGIRSLGTGLLLIAPGTVPNFLDFAGNNATLAQFIRFYTPPMTLTKSELQLPGKNQKAWRNGDLCGTTPGTLQIEVWKTVAAPSGTLVNPDPSKLKFANGQMITVAFVPTGTTIPEPPKATRTELTLLFEQSQNQSTTTTTLPFSATTTTAPTGPQTTTTRPSSSTTTTKPGTSTTTTAPSGSTTTSTKPKP